MIEMDVWDSAKAVAAERLKSARSESGKLEHEVAVRKKWLTELREQVCPERWSGHGASLSVHVVCTHPECQVDPLPGKPEGQG